MKDSILKGTGNSRCLKSAVPAGTSWADALAMLRAGTFPIDFNGVNIEGFQQVGTPLNKANLLKDATALTLGLTGDVVPNDMFNALAHAGDLHVWRKTKFFPISYKLGDAVQQELLNTKDSTGQSAIYYGSTVAVSDSLELSIPNAVMLGVSGDTTSLPIVGKFFYVSLSSQHSSSLVNKKIYYVPPTAEITIQSNPVRFSAPVQDVIATEAFSTATYPVSTNRNAYQEGNGAKPAGYVVGEMKTGSFAITSKSSPGGVGTRWNDSAALSVSDDGTCTLATTGGTYIDGTTTNAATTAKNELQGKFAYCNNTDTDFVQSVIVFFPSNTIFTKVGNIVYADRYQPVTGYAALPANTTIEYLGCLGEKTRMQVVSYVGTGTYGADNPCSITADFKIKLAMMLGYFDTTYGLYNSLANSSANNILITSLMGTEYKKYYGFTSDRGNYPAYGKISEDQKTFSWYGTSSRGDYYNSSAYSYYILVIG